MILGALIGAAATLFLILYGVLGDDDERAALLIIFQVTMQVMLAALMNFHMLYHTAEQAGNTAFRAVFEPQVINLSPVDSDTATIATLGAILTVGLAPVVLEAIGESKLDS
jgi:hypothetical protein